MFTVSVISKPPKRPTGFVSCCYWKTYCRGWAWGGGHYSTMKCGDLLQLCKVQMWLQDTPKPAHSRESLLQGRWPTSISHSVWHFSYSVWGPLKWVLKLVPSGNQLRNKTSLLLVLVMGIKLKFRKVMVFDRWQDFEIHFVILFSTVWKALTRYSSSRAIDASHSTCHVLYKIILWAFQLYSTVLKRIWVSQFWSPRT